MKRWAGLCLLGMLMAAKAWAIEAVVSYTPFYLPEGNKPYLEMMWQVDPASMRFTQNAEGHFISKIKTDVLLKAGTATLAEDHFILQTIPAATLTAAKLQTISDLQRYMVATGKITAHITLTDLNDTTNTFVWQQEIIIDTPAKQGAYYSGIQLLDTFYNSATKSIFLKNDKYQLPLSTNFIDDHHSSLKFYTELYHTNLVPEDQYPLVQHIYISKKKQESVVYKLKRSDTIKKETVLPYLGALNIGVLPSGNYHLNIDLLNNSNKTIASTGIFFQRSNKNPVAAVADTAASDSVEKVNILDLANTFVGKFNISQLKAILKMLQPIANPVETENIKTFLKRPDLIYMQYFVYNFWSNRDKRDPKKAWEQYANKVRDVNKILGKGAYETDRGHIYLKYGKPTERVIVENENGSLPYEVWQYNEIDKMSNALFLFYRPVNMLNDMQLLHSNVAGEVRNLNWRIQLYLPGTASTDHTNARVEQYLYKR